MCSKSIQVANGRISSFLVAEYYPVVRMHHSFLVLLSADGHSGCSHASAAVENAAANTGHIYLVGILLSFPLGTSTEVELLGCMVARFLIFRETSILFPIVVGLVRIPTNSVRGD